jgi:hypothetical protein
MSDEEEEERGARDAENVATLWGSVNLTELRAIMDEQAETIASFSEECRASRGALVASTSEFKDQVEAEGVEVPVQFKTMWPSLLKQYREEVNGLSQR